MTTQDKKQAQAENNKAQAKDLSLVKSVLVSAAKSSVKSADMWQAAVSKLAIYCIRWGDYNQASVELNKVKSTFDANLLPLHEVCYWLKNVAGIDCHIPQNQTDYKSKKTDKDFISEIGIAFTYDKNHEEKCSNRDFAYWRVMPKKDLTKTLTVKSLDDTFKSVLRTLAAEILAGKRTEDEINSYISSIPKTVHDLQANESVKKLSKRFEVETEATIETVE